MNKECQKRLIDIANQFKQSRQTFVALGDETRQLIILALLEENYQGLRV
ncbi:MAG: hypothetical protein RR585_01420 [Coprobacillus sp.]